MSKVQQQQTSFNGGVVSKYIEARPDIAKYFSSVRVGNNLFFMPEGGFRGRAGSRKVTTTKSDGVAYQFAFKPNALVNYVLEFGNLYVRFYRDGAPLLVAGIPYEIVTPYLIADIPQMLATGARQKVDVLYLDAAGYEPRKLSRFADTNWTLTLATLDPGPTGEQDWPIPTTVAISVAGGITGFVGAEVLSSGTPFLDADADKDFIYDSGKASITAVTLDKKLTIDVVDSFPLVEGTHYVKKTSIMSGAGATMTSAAHGLAIGDFVERATNVGTPTGLPSGEVRKVINVTNPNTAIIDSAFTANPNTGTGWYKVLPVAANLSYLRGSPQTTFDVSAKEPIGKVMTGTFGINAARPEDVNKIIKLYGGSVRITAYTNALNITVKIVTALVDSSTPNPAAAAAGAWRMEQPLWSVTRGFPTANEFDQGRLYHAGSASDVTTVIGSRVNNYSNYSTGALATDAIAYTHASGSFDRIHWLLSASGIFFGNSHAETSMRGAGVGAPLGGDEQPAVVEQSFEGSAAIRPVKLSKSFLFVGPGGIGIYAMKTDNESAEIGKYKSTLANILAREIESPGVSVHPIAIMRRPFNVAFFKISNGAMLALTNDDDEDVHAFSVWSTDGEIESFCVINHPDGNRDQIWLIVNRTINGVTKRYVEVLEDGGHDTALCAYAQFVTDCAMKITKTTVTPETTLTGLTHLAAKVVDVMMYRTDQPTVQNPRYMGQFTVSGAGVVTLNEIIDYTAVFEVGLPIDARVQTLRPGIPKTLTEGHTRKWGALFLRLIESIPPKVNGENMSFDFAVDPITGVQLGDQGPRLTTGDKKVRSDNWHYDEDGYVTIERSIPGPFQIAMAYGWVDFTGDFK